MRGLFIDGPFQIYPRLRRLGDGRALLRKPTQSSKQMTVTYDPK